MQKIKFRFQAGHSDAFARLGELRSVFLDLTNRCNLSCGYCFNYRTLQSPPLDLDLELIAKALRSKLAASVTNWYISGGEPTLYPRLPEALELLHHNGKKPKIATNGTRLTADLLRSWADLGVQSVQFSLDTLDPRLHTDLKGGSRRDHAALLENIERAVGSPLRVVVSSVLTTANKGEIKDILAFCFRSGVSSHTLYPNVPSEELGKDLIVPFPELVELADELFAAYQALCPVKLIDMTVPCFSDTPVYARWKDILAIRLHYCSAAQYAVKVASDGRVSACICQEHDPFIIGDLRRESLDEIWVSDKARAFRTLYEQIPECRLCAQKDICRGGCRNNAYLLGSQGLASLDPYCRYLRSG